MQASKFDIPLTPPAVSNAAANLGTPISPRAARDAINAHRIGYVKIGRARYTSRDDLIAFIESCKVPPRPTAAQVV